MSLSLGGRSYQIRQCLLDETQGQTQVRTSKRYRLAVFHLDQVADKVGVHAFDLSDELRLEALPAKVLGLPRTQDFPCLGDVLIELFAGDGTVHGMFHVKQ